MTVCFLTSFFNLNVFLLEQDYNTSQTLDKKVNIDIQKFISFFFSLINESMISNDVNSKRSGSSDSINNDSIVRYGKKRIVVQI